MSAHAKNESDEIHTIAGPLDGEPRPIWKHAPRHLPHVEFPPYRHVDETPVRHFYQAYRRLMGI